MKQVFFVLVLGFCAFISACAQTGEKIELISQGSKLNAFFYSTPDKKSSPTVILLHGLPGNDQSPLDLAKNLNQAGFNILVFNYRGSFSSEGYFSHFNCMEDLDAAIDWLKQPDITGKFQIDTSRIIVCGYSFGGGVVLWQALKNPAIRNIVSIAGLDQSVSLKEMAADTTKQAAFIQRAAWMKAPSGPLKFDPDRSIHDQILDIIRRSDELDVVKYAEKLKDRNILFITGSFDIAVPMQIHQLPLYQKLTALGARNISQRTFNTGHQFNEVRPELAKAIEEWVMGL